ncbi:MAG: Mg-protoporphyrin IX monomethyl ester oxidative cyclase, partial [Candidatus Electrothrix sp. AR3]|nr:Mg-protoporphyrin IX monomethyl ester oxidative cyclase [Candidatus Electrothrix sp. AR3]
MFHLISINCRYSHSCLAQFYVRNALEEHLPDQPVMLSQLTINDPYYSTLL